MSDLIQMEMTLDEARETDRMIKRHINTTRYLLLDMRDRKGWKALGYESFKDYGEKELGYQEAYVYRLVDAAEISLQLGYSPDSPIGESPKETHLRPLKSVPEDERKAIWEEATRKAEEEGAKLTAKRIEDAVAEWKQRQQESQAESNERRKTIRDLEQQIDLLKAQSAPEPEQVVVPPADYETAKAKAAQLESELETLKKEQANLVNSQVKAKLHEREAELDKMERKKNLMEEQVDRMKAYMASLESDAKRAEAHQRVIEEQRLHLISLAAFLSDMEPMQDREIVRQWLALAEMCMNASHGIQQVFGEKRPALTVVRGDAA